MIKTLILLLFLISSPLFAKITWEDSAPGSFNVQISLPKNEIRIQDQLIVTVRLKFPKDYEPDLDSLKRNLLWNPSFDELPFILKKSEIIPPAINSDETMSQTVLFTLEPQLLGQHAFSFLNVSFLSKTGEKNNKVEILSEIFKVTVNPISTDRSFNIPLAPLLTFSLKYPIEISPENREDILDNANYLLEAIKSNLSIIKSKAIPWLEIFCMVLVALFFWLDYQPSKATQIQQLLALPKDPKSQSLQALSRLKDQNLPSQKHLDQFYVELSNIVRQYLEKKYQFKAPHYTTEEFLLNASLNPKFSQHTRDLLTSFMQHADLVKFAKQTPSIEDCDNAFVAAESFITKQSI